MCYLEEAPSGGPEYLQLIPPCPTAHFDRWLVGDELGQALSQLAQVANLDVQDLDDAPHLHLRLRLLLLAGGQCLLSALDLTLQLGVSSLHILRTDVSVWKKMQNGSETSRFQPFWQEEASGLYSSRLRNPLMKTPHQVCFGLNCFSAYLSV